MIWRRSKAEPEAEADSEPVVLVHPNIPFGVHPLLDFLRFTLLLLDNQRSLADAVLHMTRSYNRMRAGLLAVMIASPLATLAQAFQIWARLAGWQ